MISADSKGGKSYRLFREALRRLSAVRYQNDGFFDPIRREHRAVSFGLLSYSLPLAPDSSRAWRILWDPLFFEYFHGDNGAGLGASHQTGWTALVAKILQQIGEYREEDR